LLLPSNNLVRSGRHVSELTVVQINMLAIIENMKMERLWGGENGNG
jgi:hypothetical protein